ncbi:trypsin-like [Phlebotomus argentipes]|uniref:trypsin-like n=1 Tax=Phlebotomus argentipes TaxID=94469 RepID=UPI0028931687|nr:trypsin-like [Phlebotomus argentipes]
MKIQVSTSSLLLAFLLCTASVLGQDDQEDDTTTETQYDDYDDSDVPVIPVYIQPRFDEEGDFKWFPRIIGGTQAVIGEFPGKVSLQTRLGSHFCGGTLIDLTHILTAAHCVTDSRAQVLNPAAIQIMAGDVSIVRNDAAPTREVRFLSHIFVHPDYDIATMENDIAVLRLSLPFRLQQGVVSPQPLSRSIPAVGTVCNLAGWGTTAEGSNTPSPTLQRVDLDIIDTDRCNQSYRGLLSANMFCAGHMAGGRDSCQGDSGGGLMCNNIVTGIVSFGYGCGRRHFPGVYIDVSQYIEWIETSQQFEGAHVDIPTPRPAGAAAFVPSALLILAGFLVKSCRLF